MSQRWTRAVGAGVLALILAACSGAPTPEPKAAGTSRQQRQGSHANPAQQAVAAASPRQVRLAMERVLGHHAVLMIRLMRSPLDGEPAFRDAAREAIDRDTDELVQLVQSVYGPDAGARFRSVWDAHVTALLAYSQAVADDDAAQREARRSQLEDYAGQYGDMVSQLTEGRLSAGAVASGVSAHIAHMLEATDAYADGDYRAAFRNERVAFAAMFGQGKVLSSAALRQHNAELPASFDGPRANLRSALGRLLGEHTELAFDATRAIAVQHPSAQAAAEGLNANTQEIITAMQAAVGKQGASQFGRIWADHIDAIVAFSVAVAEQDDAGQSTARAELDNFPGQLGPMLQSVSRGKVEASQVVAALQQHDEQLMQQVTAYAADDYETAHTLAYEGYEHMFAIADTLAAALEGRSAAGSPVGGAATGGGGSAHRHR